MLRNSYIKRPSEFLRTAFGELLTVQPIPITQINFQYFITNTRQYNTALTGGTFTQTDNFGVLSTTTTTGRHAALLSDRRISYRNGQGICFIGTCIFTAGVAGTKQFYGVGTVSSGAPVNGFFVGYNGTSFGVCRVVGGTENWTYIADFNGEYVDFVSENPPTKLNIWRIDYEFLGAGRITFGCESNTGDLRIFHTIGYAGTATATTVANPSMQIVGLVNNGAVASNIQLSIPSCAAFQQGIESISCGTVWSYQAVVSSTAASHILSIQNLASVNSKTNYNKIRILALDIAATDNSNALTGVFYLCGDSPTLGGVGTFTNIDSNRSQAAYNTTGTLGGVPATVIYTAVCDSKTSRNIDLSNYGIDFHPGEHVSVYFTGSGAYTSVRASLTWVEF